VIIGTPVKDILSQTVPHHKSPTSLSFLGVGFCIHLERQSRLTDGPKPLCQ
jgi:hypothetical protein